MKNIKLLNLDKYNNARKYQLLEKGIYKDIEDTDTTNIRIAISFELETDERGQYPLEDILDKYYLHVSDFLGTDIDNAQCGSVLNLILAGELEDVLNAKEILGKRVFNVTNPDNYISLVIE